MSAGGTPQQDIGPSPPPVSPTASGANPQITDNSVTQGRVQHGATQWYFNGQTFSSLAAAQAAQAAYNPSQKQNNATYGTQGADTQGTATQSSSGDITLNQTPNEQEIANSVAEEYKTEIQSTEAQQATAIGGLKAKEQAAEGQITANTAARGLKLGKGSALMELVTQQERGAQAVQYQTQQGGAAISGMQQEQAVSLGKAALEATKQEQQNAQDISNAWLQAFTFAATTAIDILQPELTPFTAGLNAAEQNSTSDLQDLAMFG